MLDGTWIKDVAIVVIAGIAWAGDELAQVINAFANFVRALFRKK
jgi:hypothetical protein